MLIMETRTETKRRETLVEEVGVQSKSELLTCAHRFGLLLLPWVGLGYKTTSASKQKFNGWENLEPKESSV